MSLSFAKINHAKLSFLHSIFSFVFIPSVVFEYSVLFLADSIIYVSYTIVLEGKTHIPNSSMFTTYSIFHLNQNFYLFSRNLIGSCNPPSYLQLFVPCSPCLKHPSGVHKVCCFPVTVTTMAVSLTQYSFLRVFLFLCVFLEYRYGRNTGNFLSPPGSIITKF
jgi:hypothetical protein